MNMNEGVFNALYGFSNKNILIDILIVFFGDYLVFGLALFAASLIFLQKERINRIYFSSLAILSVILSNGIIVPLINYFVNSPRPFNYSADISALLSEPTNMSFPSGHMMFIVPIALTVFYINRKVGYWFFGGTVLMGLSRIAGGVHWPYDILGGILIGALCFYVVKWLLHIGGFKN